MEDLIKIDHDLLIYLNQLGSVYFDDLWLLITKQFNWIPYFAFIFYLIKRQLTWKEFSFFLIFLAILIFVTDQLSNFSKNTTLRLRPCHDPNLQDKLRILHCGGKYSFFSGHASNSMATTFFTFMLLKNKSKWFLLMFSFPLIFAYSRIYLGLHFPSDIITGWIFGATFGFFMFLLYKKIVLKKDILA